MKPTGVESANQIIGQASKSGSAQWGDLEDDDDFNPDTPPGWKTEHAGNERSDSQVDDGKPETTRPRKKASPNQAISIPRRRDLVPHPLHPWYSRPRRGKVTLETNGGIIGGPVTRRQPLDPQVMDWAILQVQNLQPMAEKSAKKIIEDAAAKDPGEARGYLQQVLGTESDAMNFITDFGNKRHESEKSRPERPVKQGGLGLGKVNPYDNMPPKKGGPPGTPTNSLGMSNSPRETRGPGGQPRTRGTN